MKIITLQAGMTSFIKLLLLVAIQAAASSVSSPRCPTLKDKPPGSFCICDRGDNFNGWQFTCLKDNFETLFDIKYVTDSDVTFECGTEQPYSSALLEQLDLSQIDTFIFKSCPLPNSTFYDIILDHRVEQLKIYMKTGNKTFNEFMFQNISQTMVSLILTNNKIENLPEGIFNSFPGLKFLSLSNNNMKTLPEKIFWGLPNLEVLEIANNKLDILPENIFRGLFQLHILHLYKNKLKRLPDVLFQSLVNLKALDLSDNHLIVLPNDILVGLSQLVDIRLRGNWLEVLPRQLFNYTANLRVIDLSINKFMEPLPEELLFGLTSLENISIHDSNLTLIHGNFFSRCPNITHLNLQNNGLFVLPENIFRNNSKLIYLNLNFSNISDLPGDLFLNQKNLEKLFLFKNNISSIPAGLFRNTRSIRTLVLGRNRITNASQVLFRNLPNLESVDLSINNLTDFSLDFNEHIRSIDLSYNSLTEMPLINWVHHLKLEELNLEYNKLTSLSIPVLYSTNKRNPSLNFGHNEIKTVDVTDVTLNDDHIQDLPPKDYENYVESTISLHPNPFLCDCELYKFYNYLQKSNEARKRSVRFSFIQNFTCQGPPKLASKRISLLTGSEFSCNLKEGCNSLCKCYLRAKDGARVVDCSSQGLTTPPNIAPKNTNILYLQNNNLSHIEELNDPIWKNLLELYLDKNNLNSIHGWTVPPKLLNLVLRENQLQQLPRSLLNYTSHVDRFRMSLGKNPWSCNCSNKYFKKWLTQHIHVVSDIKDVRCAKKSSRQNNTLIRIPVFTIQDDEMCPVDDWPYRAQLIAVTTVCVILALLLFTVSVLYYRNKQTVIAYVYIHLHNVFMCIFREEDMDEDKIFDAFVSYSSADQDVALKLLEELENKDPFFRLCIHERNWLAGNLISWNIINSVQNSRRTILVISKEFLESMWFQIEFHTAYYQMLEDKIDRVIVIVKGELPPKDTLDADLQHLLSTKTYLVWEEKWFWEKLKYAMPHKKQNVINNDIMALKDRPDSKKIKTVENQIAILSSRDKTILQNGALTPIQRDKDSSVIQKSCSYGKSYC